MEDIWENDWRLELWSILGNQNDAEIGPLGPIFNTLLSVAQIDMYTKTDAQPVEKFWENCQRSEFSLILGAQSVPKIGSLRPIFSTHLKVLAMSTWSKTVVRPVKTFGEIDQTPEFLITLGPKRAQKLGLWRPYFTHLWKKIYIFPQLKYVDRLCYKFRPMPSINIMYAAHEHLKCVLSYHIDRLVQQRRHLLQCASSGIASFLHFSIDIRADMLMTMFKIYLGVYW